MTTPSLQFQDSMNTGAAGEAFYGATARTLTVNIVNGLAANSIRLISRPAGPESDYTSTATLGEIGTTTGTSFTLDKFGPFLFELWSGVDSGHLAKQCAQVVIVKDETGMGRKGDQAVRAAYNFPGSGGRGYVYVDDVNLAAIRVAVASGGGYTSGNLHVTGTLHVDSTTELDDNVNVGAPATSGVTGGAFDSPYIVFQGAIADSDHPGKHLARSVGIKMSNAGGDPCYLYCDSGIKSAADVSGATVTSAGTVTGVNGTFSGNVSGVAGTFSGAVSGTTVTGSSTVTGQTFTQSALDQISTLGPTQCAPTARTSGNAFTFYATAPNDTGQATTQEALDFGFFGGTKTWATGAIALQRWARFVPGTAAFVGASTITESVGAEFRMPGKGTNATVTRGEALRVESVGNEATTCHEVYLKRSTALSGTTVYRMIEMDHGGTLQAGIGVSRDAFGGLYGALTASGSIMLGWNTAAVVAYAELIPSADNSITCGLGGQAWSKVFTYSIENNAAAAGIKIGASGDRLGFYATTPVVRSATSFNMQGITPSYDVVSATPTVAQLAAVVAQLVKDQGHTSGTGLWKATA